jgi:hypothetical protein
VFCSQNRAPWLGHDEYAPLRNRTNQPQCCTCTLRPLTTSLHSVCTQLSPTSTRVRDVTATEPAKPAHAARFALTTCLSRFRSAGRLAALLQPAAIHSVLRARDCERRALPPSHALCLHVARLTSNFIRSCTVQLRRALCLPHDVELRLQVRKHPQTHHHHHHTSPIHATTHVQTPVPSQLRQDPRRPPAPQRPPGHEDGGLDVCLCAGSRALRPPHAPTHTSPAGRPLTRSLHVVRSQKDDRGLDMAVEDAKYRMSALLATHRTATCR